MPTVFHTDFRQTFGPGRYPFADTSSLLANSGELLPLDVFVDASVYIVGAVEQISLRNISIGPSTTRFDIGDAVTEQLASGVFDKFNPTEVVPLSDLNGKPSGLVVLDPVAAAIFQTWDIGEHNFDLGAAEFVASCTIAMPSNYLQGIRLPSGEILAGDVWLVGKDGVVLREQDGDIRVDIVGDPLFLRKLCSPAGRFETPLFIERINNVGPNQRGDFTIAVASNQASDTALRIYPTAEDTLRIEIAGKTIKG